MAKNPKQPVNPTKKHLARQQRERRQTRIIVFASLAVLAVIIALIGFGVLDQKVLTPREVVATVNGEQIRADQFEGQVRYARYSAIQSAYSIVQFMQYFGNDASILSSFASQLQQIQYQLNKEVIGQQVLENMIDNLLIRQEAERRGITVSEEEIELAFQEAFSFYANGQPTATPTLEAVPTSTLSALQMTLVPPTPTALPTATPAITPTEEVAATPAVAQTGTPEAELTPTAGEPAAPTATAGPTSSPTPYTLEGYQTLRQETLQSFAETYGIQEADLRYVMEAQVYRQKVMDALLAEQPIDRFQEQVWLRQIQTSTEEAANTVLQNLRDGADFATQASLLSEDTATNSSGGDLGWLSRDSLVSSYGEDYANTAFELEIGEISEPLETTFGYAIIQVLGHEDRALSGDEIQSLKESVFSEWLAKQNEEAETEIKDVMINHVPEEPALPDEITQVIESVTQSLNSTQPNLPTDIPLPSMTPGLVEPTQTK